MARGNLILKFFAQCTAAMENQAWRASFFTYDKGKLFDDRERAAENVFVQVMYINHFPISNFNSLIDSSPYDVSSDISIFCRSGREKDWKS